MMDRYVVNRRNHMVVCATARAAFVFRSNSYFRHCKELEPFVKSGLLMVMGRDHIMRPGVRQAKRVMHDTD